MQRQQMITAAMAMATAGADDAAEGNAPAQEAEHAQGAYTPAPRASLRDAAAAILNAWDASAAQDASNSPANQTGAKGSFTVYRIAP
ncbi:hypothetical protein [Roseococcus suduntuyensis]|uniref:Uncharacterized protein n=1 Tax=Roseococcus suduntuyensis TaxID=455361 RepID=A0A840AEP9_9PROT|nr:hypothetical protein [Roseococcus suduntuyensis]MBB3898565.1 hypothetical protein [Roseococcus suduntuyensis]